MPMHDHFDWSRLDAAAYRVSMKRSVRRVAWGMAALGAVIVACGIAAPFAPLISIGLVFVCAGAWNASRPSIHGLIVDGVAMILAGVFQCLLLLWIKDARPTSVGRWAIAA